VKPIYARLKQGTLKEGAIYDVSYTLIYIYCYSFSDKGRDFISKKSYLCERFKVKT
jgi:hypothetical protein